MRKHIPMAHRIGTIPHVLLANRLSPQKQKQQSNHPLFTSPLYPQCATKFSTQIIYNTHTESLNNDTAPLAMALHPRPCRVPCFYSYSD